MFIIWRTRFAYSAAQSGPQHSIVVPFGPSIGKPSPAPMNITTAFGRLVADLGGRDLAPVEEVGVRDPAAELRVADDLDALVREPLRELGVHRLRHRVAGDEQLLERELRRRVLADRQRVERVRGDRRHLGARAPVVAVVVVPNPPSPSSVSEERPPVSSAWASASGSESAIQPVGSPTAATRSWPIPGSISRAASSTEPPERTIRSTAVSAIASTHCIALTLRTPSRSKRLIWLSSLCVLGIRRSG